MAYSSKCYCHLSDYRFGDLGVKINDIIYNCSCNSKDLHKNPDEHDINEFKKERITRKN